ncbi:MAG: hypothetical protein SGI77_25310, partial [Pirellulaceae bacterium]|nr:hypothetical protein [Pirellulaceae bacterium]
MAGWKFTPLRTLFFAILFIACAKDDGLVAQESPVSLTDAMAREDLDAIHLAVAANRRDLGDKAGEPEESVEYIQPPPVPKMFGSSAETVGGFRDPQSILAVKYKENTGLSDCKN